MLLFAVAALAKGCVHQVRCTRSGTMWACCARTGVDEAWLVCSNVHMAWCQMGRRGRQGCQFVTMMTGPPLLYISGIGAREDKQTGLRVSQGCQ